MQVNTRTAYRWVAHFRIYGEAPTITARRNKRLKASVRRDSFGHAWTSAITRALKIVVDREPWLYLDEIQRNLHIETGMFFSTGHICKKMRDALGYSLKAISEKAIQQCLAERASYLAARTYAVKDPKMCVFINESHKSLNASRRRRFWGPKGEPSIAYTKFGPEFDIRYTLLAVADVNGFIIEACELVEREHGTNDNDLTRGTVNTERFEMWVETKLCPTLGNYFYEEPRSIVFLDNATIHHGSRVEQLIRSTGAIIIYTAPYSPDLNPIELMFSSYKRFLKRVSAQGGNTIDHHLMALF